MDILETADGRLFISTESGGINEMEGSAFHHFNTANHRLPSDCVQSLTAMGNGSLLIVCEHLIALLDRSGQVRVLDARYFHADYRFSDAHPLLLADGRWLFGMNDGAFTTSVEQMYHKTATPRIVLTRISIQGGQNNWAAEALDTLTLQPRERSLTIHFAALDYSTPERISYAFRLRDDDKADSTQWNYIGHDRSATLLDLEPGTYHMEIRSTNADGEWGGQPRRLVIIVKPTFWEAWYGQLLLVLLIAGMIAIVLYTLLYIRRIKRKQRETLAKYLELMENRNEPQKADVHPQDEALPDPMLERVMAFIEDHLSDSDVNVGDMAAAAATSRSGLQRKLKQAMGITPQDLLREARIKHACLLLGNSDKTVAEVAYACGFTDPKYFSRCFKQSTGQSPTEYRK
jgi:AraC-like DNA-binding protein